MWRSAAEEEDSTRTVAHVVAQSVAHFVVAHFDVAHFEAHFEAHGATLILPG